MKLKDWVKLTVMVVIFVVCWVWVVNIYDQSLGSDEYINEILAESNITT